MNNRFFFFFFFSSRRRHTSLTCDWSSDVCSSDLFASAATLYEVGFNHFFHGRSEGESANDGEVIFFQGHAAPGIYARAYLEGRIDETHLENFRRELKPGGGLSSYPHPWLMPDFWEYPTVSMGLGPLMAIYQARFM